MVERMAECGPLLPPRPETDTRATVPADRIAAQVAAQVRHMLDTCPACTARAAARDATPVLSPRRRQILELASHGLTYDQIARELFVTLSTVRATLRMVRRILGAHDTTHAVAIAIRLGIID